MPQRSPSPVLGAIEPKTSTVEVGGARRGAVAGRMRRSILAAGAALIACSLTLAPRPSIALGADFTWSGNAASGTPSWSNGFNWAGGTAPTGTVGTLTFSTLGSCPSTKTCYTSDNDVTGLVADRIAIDVGSPYNITGKGITLDGGVTASSTGVNTAGLNLPIALGAPNTWTIDGTNGGSLAVLGAISGASKTLAIDVANGAALDLIADNEVGAVSIAGHDPDHSGIDAISNGLVIVGTGSKLNATDGNSVVLTDAQVRLEGFQTTPAVAIGPLTSAGGAVEVTDGIATVEGSVTLDSNSALLVGINQPGTTAGTDYGQLSAKGAVSLGTSTLDLLIPDVGGGPCPALSPGDVDTLVTTTGSLVGRFAGIPQGALVTTSSSLGCQGQSTLRVSYTPHTVTATVVSSGPSTTTSLSHSPSSPISGKPVTLTATVTPSSGTPVGSVEFDNKGRAIPGCKARPLTGSGSTRRATCRTAFTAASSPEVLTATFASSSATGPQSSTSDKYVVVVRPAVPDTKITKAKIARTRQRAKFKFKALGVSAGFGCAIVKVKQHKKPKPHFSSCQSPKTYTGLAPGRYRFLVRAFNATGADPTPAKKSFKI
jgi:hypothetical protein